MKTKKISRFTTAALILIPALFTRCSDKEDLPNGKSYKFTITVNNVMAEDRAQFLIVGGSPSGDATMWKVNGATRNNEQGVGFNTVDFSGATKTYVIESARSLTNVQVSIQCINFNTPFTYSYKAEVNGAVKHDQKDITMVEGAPFSTTYTY
jgi:hypothetical protein